MREPGSHHLVAAPSIRLVRVGQDHQIGALGIVGDGDVGAGEVFDANALDPSTRPQAARGGYAQGRALARPLADFWV